MVFEPHELYLILAAPDVKPDLLIAKCRVSQVEVRERGIHACLKSLIT